MRVQYCTKHYRHVMVYTPARPTVNQHFLFFPLLQGSKGITLRKVQSRSKDLSWDARCPILWSFLVQLLQGEIDGANGTAWQERCGEFRPT